MLLLTTVAAGMALATGCGGGTDDDPIGEGESAMTARGHEPDPGPAHGGIPARDALYDAPLCPTTHPGCTLAPAQSTPLASSTLDALGCSNELVWTSGASRAWMRVCPDTPAVASAVASLASDELLTYTSSAICDACAGQLPGGWTYAVAVDGDRPNEPHKCPGACPSPDD